MGVTLLNLTVQGPTVWQLSHSVYGQLKDFLGLLLDLDHGFESENVNFSTWGSILEFLVLPNRSSWDELGSSL